MFGDDRPLVRLDMSEYLGSASIDRFLATGPQSLGQRLRAMPLNVVLLDEIEKADPRLFDVLSAMLVADPTAKIAVGGITGLGAVDHDSIEGYEFIRQMLEAGDPMDYVSDPFLHMLS